jgi:hypothetical protein
MQPHELLFQKERSRRFTVSDSIDVLTQSAAFGLGDLAKIRITVCACPRAKWAD